MELKSTLASGEDSVIEGGVTGEVEDEVEAPSDGLEGICRDIAIDRSCDRVGEGWENG